MGAMDTVVFRVEESDIGPVIAIDVDGVPLQDLAGAPEGFGGLLVTEVGDPRSWFLGDRSTVWTDEGQSVLLGCPACGELTCAPLYGVIEVDDARVTWSRFGDSTTDWDGSGLGPFTFDRSDYDSALTRLVEEMATRVPPTPSPVRRRWWSRR